MKENSFSIQGRIIDVVRGRVYPGTVEVSNGKIKTVREEPVKELVYILPGLVDAHIHIESSMLILMK
jgi:adenine deaminase